MRMSLRPKRLSARGVLVSVETTSSVPPDFLICDRPDNLGPVRALLIVNAVS
jgi:hypothetical protein